MPLIRITETEETTKKPMDLLPEGMYEVFVESVDTPEAFGEFEKSTLVLKIRNDLKEEFANRKIWVNLNTNPAIAWKLSTIARAAGVPAGTDFDTFSDYLLAVKGASMKVNVKHRVYNEKTYLDVKGFYPTREKPYEVPTESDDDLII